MKRKRKNHVDRRADKRPKLEPTASPNLTWPLLRQYYPEVSTLRTYLAGRLSKSKKRRRRLLRYGLDGNDRESNTTLVALLDETIVGSFIEEGKKDFETFEHDLTIFTQHLSGSTAVISPTQGALIQSEVGTILSLYTTESHS